MGCTALIPKIVVSYATARADTDGRLNPVTFTKASHKNAQGDKSLKVDLDFIIVNGMTEDGVKPI
ncbi:hypothetical protein [Paenibacillus melissococcoides]|uniref:hypothetical protein n=1 Tax=Paenibacillus melissococcoides TaxID=2912268 RepID=UPI0021C3C3C4|nr:hypothetical protein [Paenibacillus melissococcoides]CAH8721944.1 hypothetical protein HTL2_006615 [Paenibacillus melissococcoides]